MSGDDASIPRIRRTTEVGLSALPVRQHYKKKTDFLRLHFVCL